MKKLKVCITTVEYPPQVGGIGQSVQRIARYMSSLDYEIHVVVISLDTRGYIAQGTYRRAGFETSTDNDNITVHTVKASIKHEQYFAADFLHDIYYQLKLLHRKYEFNLFHSFYVTETGFVTTMLGKEKGVPVICSARGADLHRDIFQPLNSHTIWTLENADWLTFVSTEMMQRAYLLAPNIVKKSSVIFNSIEPIDFAKLPTLMPVDSFRGIVIGTIGLIRQKKGIEYLFDACASIASEVDFTLLLIGDFKEKERGYWNHEVKNSGIENNIVVTGLLPREEAISRLYHNVDIFVLPSLHDGCPNALLEAMLASKPIIGAKTDAIREVIEHGVDGILVNPASAVEISDELRNLIANPGLRTRLSQAARQKASLQFTPIIEKNNWDACYKNLISF